MYRLWNIAKHTCAYFCAVWYKCALGAVLGDRLVQQLSTVSAMFKDLFVQRVQVIYLQHNKIRTARMLKPEANNCPFFICPPDGRKVAPCLNWQRGEEEYRAQEEEQNIQVEFGIVLADC